MNFAVWLEIFGYVGSAMVVISMLMSSVVKLRIINTVGSVISGTYALIIGSFPLALMNISLVIINLYNLRKLLMSKQQYHLVKCGAGDGAVGFFLEQYLADIRIYFPEFSEAGQDCDVCYLIFCGTAPAGILLGRLGENTAVQVQLEYTTPAYRDCSIGKFLYKALPFEGVEALTVETWSEKHGPYLEKMGFALQDGQYRKVL